MSIITPRTTAPREDLHHVAADDGLPPTLCTSMIGLSPVTVTVSSSDPTFMSALIVAVSARSTRRHHVCRC
jgi:hypothetical protein